MVHLSIRHTIEAYTTWRERFDAYATARQTAGATGVSQVFRDVEHPNQITVLLEWDTTANARKYASDPALKEFMLAAGVMTTPEVRFMNRV